MLQIAACLCGLLTVPIAPASQAGKTLVIIDTSMGPITVELDAEKAPITVANFLKYVDSAHYDNTIFHRVIGPNPRQPRGFMIQGGGFTAPKTKNDPPAEKATGEGIKNEAGNGLKNTRGTLAMARTRDPNSATAQFFINLDENGFLNRESSPDGFGYAVFGAVVEGMDVVDAIAKVDTGEVAILSRDTDDKLVPIPSDDVPTTPVVIKSIKRKTNP